MHTNIWSGCLCMTGLAQLRQGGLTTTDQILVAEKAGAWSEALALYEQALSQEAAASCKASSPLTWAAAGEGEAARGRRVGPAAADVLMKAACAVVSTVPGSSSSSTAFRLDTWMGLQHAASPAVLAAHHAPRLAAAAEAAADPAAVSAAVLQHGALSPISDLQVGQLRCLLQMGRQQTVLKQVDGLMAHCLGQASAAAAATAAAATVQSAEAAAASEAVATALQGVKWSLGQLAALGVAASWRLGFWHQLRGYMSVLEAAGNSPAGLLRVLSAGDRWEVRNNALTCGLTGASQQCRA